jgi:hypothetical protein
MTYQRVHHCIDPPEDSAIAFASIWRQFVMDRVHQLDAESLSERNQPQLKWNSLLDKLKILHVQYVRAMCQETDCQPRHIDAGFQELKTAAYQGIADPKTRDDIQQAGIVPDSLTRKVGAVVLIRNGAQGHIYALLPQAPAKIPRVIGDDTPEVHYEYPEAITGGQKRTAV